MIRHLFKMVWNRKRANFLVMVEIFFSFLVLAGVSITAIYYLQNYRRPLGFSCERVWKIETNFMKIGPEKKNPEAARQLYLALENMPEIEAFSGSDLMPYIASWSYNNYHFRGKDFIVEVGSVTPGFKQVLGLQLTDGRWFQPGDETLSWDPAVITETMKEEVFGSEDPIGKNIAPPKAERERRIIGVVAAYRMHGEFTSPLAYTFKLNRWMGKEGGPDRPPSFMLVKVRPGTTAAFEEKMLRRLQGINKDWSYTLNPMAESRRAWLTFSLAPVVVVGIIAAFLIIMVGLGMVGVLWQTVTQRTREIGLRRALGGTQNNIHQQILGELLVLTTLSLLIGALLVMQIPLLQIISFLATRLFLFGIAISALLIYSLIVLCGLYPSWMAARVQPAEALHYE